MKGFLFLFFMALAAIKLQAQDVRFEWARPTGPFISAGSSFVQTDATGNVYNSGFFWGNADFDPGSNTFNLTSRGQQDVYLSKSDAAGNFTWAISIGGPGEDISVSGALDNTGNIYLSGWFSNTVDFDPGAGTHMMSSITSRDFFVVKLDSDGNFIWAKQFGSRAYNAALYIAVDASANVYVSGNFTGSPDFDPGPASFPLSTTVAPLMDVFVLKLDSSGNFLWVKQVVVASSNYVYDIAVDGQGNVFTTGNFAVTADFDPGPGYFNLTTAGDYDAYILKLDKDGNFAWATGFGNINVDGGGSVVADATGNLYCSGSFQGVVDFDPGPGSTYLASLTSHSGFLIKLNPAGNLAWAKRTDAGDGKLTVDQSGNLYSTGSFSGIEDVDPGPGVFQLNSMGQNDVFVMKLDPAGTFIWAKQFGGPGGEGGTAISVDANKNVYTTGYFQASVDFDPGSCGYVLNAAGNFDLFVHKMSPCVNGIRNMTAAACASYTLMGKTYTSSGMYQQQFPGPACCDSILILDLTITSQVLVTQDVTICNGGTFQGYNSSGTYTDTLVTTLGCDSIRTVHLTVLPALIATAAKTICYGDSFDGYSSSGIYVDTLVSFNGCDSIRTLLLSVMEPVYTEITQSICAGQNYYGYNSSGTYTDTLVSVSGCDSVRIVHLTVFPISSAVINKVVCGGMTYNGHSASGSYVDTLVGANGCDSIVTLQLTVLPKIYSLRTHSICQGQIFEGHGSSGIYTDTLGAENGCDSLSILQLTVLPLPSPALGPGRILCLGDSVLLDPGGFDVYLWQDGSASRNLIVKEPGRYSVTVRDKCGTATAEVILTGKICDIYFPSAFTPNNDGLNDVFRILRAFDLKDYRLVIYNRWGQTVFESRDYVKGWNGMLKGQVASAGAYVWYASFKRPGVLETITLKGEVLLIR